MASLNKIILIGNLTRDVEVRTFPSGGRVANVGLATNERWKDKATGEMMERAEFHNLVFNDKLAEIAAKHLKKGSQIYVEGQLRSRKYQDKDGVERTVYEVRVRELKLLGGKDGESDRPMSQRAPAPAPRQAPAKSSSGFDDLDDDLPPF